MAKTNFKKGAIKKSEEKPYQGWLDSFEKWCQRNERISISFILLLSALLSFLNFDVKLSIGHDDALYIEGGFNYAKDFFGYYYTANAPLYVMFLALPISLFGMNIIILKLFSVLFFLGSTFIFYRAFRNRIPHSVLLPVLLLVSTNWYLIEFASLTYTECFYMFMASIFLWVWFRVIDALNSKGDELRKLWPQLMLLSFMIFILGFTRSITVVVILAVLLHLLIKKAWKSALLTLLLFLGFRFGYDQLRETLWGSQGQFSNQLEIILRKEAYNPESGTEDFNGFINRFTENSVIYLSGRLYEILGMKSEMSEYKPALAVLTMIFSLLALFLAFIKKQQYILSALLYTGVILGATLFALQTSWGQGRFIMIHLPMLMVALFYLLYLLFTSKGGKGFAWLYLVMMFLFIYPGLAKAVKGSTKKMNTLKKNLKGDIFAGYTDDYKNYLKLSQWCADSLPKESVVACRKSPMSFVYGNGMNFYGIYQASETEPADSVLKRLSSANVTHVILAQIRVNPKMPASDDGGYINTVHRLVYPIQDRLEFIKQEGTSEPSALFRINYTGTPYEQNRKRN